VIGERYSHETLAIGSDRRIGIILNNSAGAKPGADQIAIRHEISR
jgi:hypothetical protein